MKISLRTLSLTNFNASDQKKFNFIKEINSDEKISEFVMDNVGSLFINNNSKIGPAYIVKDKDEYVGFVYFENATKEKIVLNYGVHKDHRNKKYGTKILEEVSNFILDKTVIKNVELHINGYNIGSIKCAKGANFKLEETMQLGFNNEMLTFRKHK